MVAISGRRTCEERGEGKANGAARAGTGEGGERTEREERVKKKLDRGGGLRR